MAMRPLLAELTSLGSILPEFETLFDQASRTLVTIRQNEPAAAGMGDAIHDETWQQKLQAQMFILAGLCLAVAHHPAMNSASYSQEMQQAARFFAIANPMTDGRAIKEAISYVREAAR